MRKHTDIFIAGGGVAGLTAAAAFDAAGFSVVIVDPAPPVTDGAADGADLRSTAFLQPARDALIKAGLWSRLQDAATPLAVMRIVDASGEAPYVERSFDAAEIGDEPFGCCGGKWWRHLPGDRPSTSVPASVSRPWSRGTKRCSSH
jgi:2-octaprenyl-6-methoxyphenol hydroxylase